MARPADRDDFLAEIEVPAPRQPHWSEHQTTPNHADYHVDRLERRLRADQQKRSSVRELSVESCPQQAGESATAALESESSPAGPGEPFTVLERFLAAGISRARFEAHLAAGRVRVAGRRGTNPDTPAPRPCPIVLGPDHY